MSDANFGLIDSFQVDNGELDGLTPAQCFTLGVEWQMVAAKADQPAAFSCLIHSANADRLRKMLDKRGRVYGMRFMENDSSEAWMMLLVKPTHKLPVWWRLDGMSKTAFCRAVGEYEALAKAREIAYWEVWTATEIGDELPDAFEA